MATFILSQPPEQRESLMDALPPRDYDRVIRPIPPPASVLLDAHRRGLSMARTVNDGFSDDILALEQAHEACSKHLEYLGNLIKSLRLRESVQQNLFLPLKIVFKLKSMIFLVKRQGT